MERYWDLTEKQRAELTEAQMEPYYAIERMEAGAVMPIPPEYKNEDKPDVATKRYYTVEHRKGYSTDKFGVLFTTAEAAQAFIDLKPLIAESNYDLDYKMTAKTPDDLALVPMDLPTKEALLVVKPAYIKAVEAEKENKKLREEYDKSQSCYANTVQQLDSDRYRCQSLARDHKRVIDTFDTYKTTANGDEEIALRFLNKAFKPEAIAAAFAWFGMDVPSPAPSAA